MVYIRTSTSSTKLRQKMRIEVNISDYAIREVLLMEYKDRRWRLMAYLLKFLNESKKNYKIHNKKIIMINASCFTSSLLMDNRCWGFFYIT